VKLFWSSRSPYVRKVMLFAHEIGVAEQIERVPVKVSPFTYEPSLIGHNPLTKIPTLVLDSGESFFDSRVICAYLDTLHEGPSLIPDDPRARIEVLRLEALGDGLMDTLMFWLVDRLRPAELQSAPLAEVARGKLKAIIAEIERHLPLLQRTPLHVGTLAVFSALAYADFRFGDERWRDHSRPLADWFAAFAERPSAKATGFIAA
jgi:glutathione S-transferase